MASDGPGAFAIELRRRREAASLSQEELAERAGLSAKAVGALERGDRRRPYPATVRALAQALELDVEELEALVRIARAPAQDRTTSLAAGALGEAAPLPPSPIIGREREIDDVRFLVEGRAARLVTIVGPGGVGKTRLAWEVATVLARHGRTVATVELAPVRSSDLVVPMIARALGVRTASSDLPSLVAAVLADDERVVVLDNVEHVLDAAPAVAELLARCSGLRILATSRAALRIRAEQQYPLDPLTLPADGGSLLEAAATRMFVDRARAVAPAVRLDREAAAAIATICRRLDGLPLAIELAASHVRYLSPPNLLTRLDDVLGRDLVRDLPARQRTIQATLEWSLALCTGQERQLLLALSTFAGGFALDAVSSVARRDEVADPSATVHGLVEQSLVVAEPSDGPAGRFRLLEPVRTYAAGNLSDSERAALAHRHAAHFTDLAASASSGLRSLELEVWLDVLARDHANLAAALGTWISIGELGPAARLVADVWPYWALRGHAGEGRQWIEQIVDADGFADLSEDDRARALTGSAGLALATGQNAVVIRHASEAARLASTAGDERLAGEALVLLASAALFAGEEERAATAVEMLEPLAARSEDGWLRAHALTVRAQRLIVLGELEVADRLLVEAEEIARGAAGPFTLAMVLNVAATLAVLAGNDDRALERYAEAASIAADVGTTWTLVYTLPGLAGLALRRGDTVLAAALCSAGAATTERSMLTVSFGPDSRAAADVLEHVRRQLDPSELDRAWEEGRQLDAHAVVELLGAFNDRGGRS